METFIRWLVETFLPKHHLKLKPSREPGKKRAPRAKKVAQEKSQEQQTLNV